MRSTGKTFIKVEIEVTLPERSELGRKKVSLALKVRRRASWEVRGADPAWAGAARAAEWQLSSRVPLEARLMCAGRSERRGWEQRQALCQGPCTARHMFTQCQAMRTTSSFHRNCQGAWFGWFCLFWGFLDLQQKEKYWRHEAITLK